MDKEDSACKTLWGVVKLVLILSLVGEEYLTEKCISAQRVVYDYV